MTSQEHHGVSNHGQLECLSSLSKLTTKKPSMLRITLSLCGEYAGDNSTHNAAMMPKAFPCHVMSLPFYVQGHYGNKNSFWISKLQTTSTKSQRCNRGLDWPMKFIFVNVSVRYFTECIRIPTPFMTDQKCLRINEILIWPHMEIRVQTHTVLDRFPLWRILISCMFPTMFSFVNGC